MEMEKYQKFYKQLYTTNERFLKIKLLEGKKFY